MQLKLVNHNISILYDHNIRIVINSVLIGKRSDKKCLVCTCLEYLPSSYVYVCKI